MMTNFYSSFTDNMGNQKIIFDIEYNDLQQIKDKENQEAFSRIRFTGILAYNLGLCHRG